MVMRQIKNERNPMQISNNDSDETDDLTGLAFTNVTDYNQLLDDDVELDIDWNEMNDFVDASDTSSSQSSDFLDTVFDEDLESHDNVHDIRNSLSENLRFFFLKFHPSREAMNYLLKCINKHDISVPSSVYMLMKNPGNPKFEYQQVSNGKIAYFSIVDNLKYIIAHNCINTLQNEAQYQLHLKINIDGLPLFSGSNFQLWPIWMIVNGYDRPLPIGLFGGVGKPDITGYLKPLCDELTQLQGSPFLIDKVWFSLKSIIFICDAPARSYTQCIYPHTAYYGCGYCKAKGEYHENRIIFPETDATSRSDEECASVMENNQSSVSPLIGIVPLKTGFPPEYMHLVLLGVMKKIMLYIFTPTEGCQMNCRFSRSQIQNLSSELVNFSQFLPREFQRRFYKGFKELTHFKATEYRTLLLFVGPYLFQKYMRPEVYNHFMLLSFGIYCLVSEKYHKLYHSHAKACLMNFILQFPDIYDTRGLSYNVHVLQHLSDYVLIYGH